MRIYSSKNFILPSYFFSCAFDSFVRFFFTIYHILGELHVEGVPTDLAEVSTNVFANVPSPVMLRVEREVQTNIVYVMSPRPETKAVSKTTWMCSPVRSPVDDAMTGPKKS